MFTLTKKQWKIVWAILETQAIDAAHGDFDRGLVENLLLEEQPSAAELRVIADVVFDEARRNSL